MGKAQGLLKTWRIHLRHLSHGICMGFHVDAGRMDLSCRVKPKIIPRDRSGATDGLTSQVKNGPLAQSQTHGTKAHIAQANFRAL